LKFHPIWVIISYSYSEKKEAGMGKWSKKISKQQLLAFFFILPLAYSLLWGLDPDKKIDSYLVDQWELSNDLPSNMIRSIKQTPDGYLWFATNKGLVRFDGIEFEVISFVKEEKGEIESRQPSMPDTLFVDRKGNLWIGSSAGLTQYDYITGRFKTFTAASGLTRDSVRHINEDMNGNLWITFYSSYVDRFSNGKFTHFNASHGLECNKINTVVEDSSGNLLFAAREKGIFIYRDGKFYKYPVPGLENPGIITMYQDKKGDLWIGTAQGLFQLSDKNLKNYTTGDGLSNNYITVILEDSDRNLWIGTEKGLNRLKKKQDGKAVFESLLKPCTIFSLFEDKEGSLWVGTYDSGIRRLKESKFTTYAPMETFPEEVIFSLFQDREGDIWVGTSSGRLFHCRGSSLVETIEFPGLSSTGILTIVKDRVGGLWLGTNGKGVFQIKNGILARFTSREGLADNEVSSIFEDSQGNLWFGTFNGISVRRCSDGIFETFTFNDGLSGKRIHNVYEDKAHNIWIAADKGITLLKNTLQIAAKRLNKSFCGVQGRFFQKEPLAAGGKRNIEYYLKDIVVTCIYEDSTVPDDEVSIFWIATHGGGLKRLSLKDGKIISYTTANGMTTDFIYQFFEDQQGHFWLMSNSGILRINKSELNSFAPDSTDKIDCISFGKSDGMKSSEFHSEFSRNSAIKTKNGELWFLTRQGIAIVNPARVRINKIPPPVVIEEVFFDQQSISPYQNANAKPFKGITNFSFQFTAPSFLSPEKIRFRYRLEGFDKEWIYLLPGEERAVHYQNLGPGTYTFKVIACNADGVWNQTGDSMTFTLQPFLYETLLFRIVVLVLLIVLLAASVYIYKKRPFDKKKKPKTSSLNPHFAEECIRKLNHLMEVEKVYHDEKLSIQSLAERLSIPPYQLSLVLNEKLSRTFFDYVNYYRIEEAKSILASAQTEEINVSTAAHQVGFNTMTTFYKVFKKFTDMTPSQYKQEVKKK
jgi:ligand-binding sensor domain-containing protein/AraC-like DNA-binding protein